MVQQNQTVIDMEIVKRVVHFVTLYRNSRSVEDKHLKRKEVLKYFAIITPTTVAIEACESSNYWRQKLAKLGHAVLLLSARIVKPFVQGTQN